MSDPKTISCVRPGAELIEPITDNCGSFRVTCYDPRLLAKTHQPGRHRYLIARTSSRPTS
jgi:hypothetical protein